MGEAEEMTCFHPLSLRQTPQRAISASPFLSSRHQAQPGCIKLMKQEPITRREVSQQLAVCGLGASDGSQQQQVVFVSVATSVSE